MKTQLKTTTFIFTNVLIFVTVSFFSGILIYEIDNIVADLFIFYVLNYAGAILSYYLMTKKNTKESKEPKQKRYEFYSVILSDFEIFAIGDKDNNKVICHLNYDNGSEYNKELGKRIVDLLNENEQ